MMRNPLLAPGRARLEEPRPHTMGPGSGPTQGVLASLPEWEGMGFGPRAGGRPGAGQRRQEGQPLPSAQTFPSRTAPWPAPRARTLRSTAPRPRRPHQHFPAVVSPGPGPLPSPPLQEQCQPSTLPRGSAQTPRPSSPKPPRCRGNTGMAGQRSGGWQRAREGTGRREGKMLQGRGAGGGKGGETGDGGEGGGREMGGGRRPRAEIGSGV